jgi:hypothetical protein
MIWLLNSRRGESYVQWLMWTGRSHCLFWHIRPIRLDDYRGITGISTSLTRKGTVHVDSTRINTAFEPRKVENIPTDT